MRYLFILLVTLSSGPSFASTSVECEELVAAQANETLLKKLEKGLLGDWKLAVPGPDGRPAIVPVLHDNTHGQWILVQDERFAAFLQQEMLRHEGNRVFRIDVRGPLDGDAILHIFSHLLTAYHGRFIEPIDVPDELQQLMRPETTITQSPLLIVWTFEPYTEIEGDRSKLWFDTLSAIGMRFRWKQVLVSDDPAFLRRIGMIPGTISKP
jgi:hypothetical protein